MTILVTGGTGSLGRPTVAQLTAAGHEVRVLSRTAGPGRVIGGPEQLRLLDAIALLQESAGTRKPVWVLSFSGQPSADSRRACT